MKQLILQTALALILIASAQAERHEIQYGKYYDDTTGQVESDPYENTNLNAPWNNPLKQEDIAAPWNDPLRQDDITAPWNHVISTPQQTNQYMYDAGVTNPDYYQTW